MGNQELDMANAGGVIQHLDIHLTEWNFEPQLSVLVQLRRRWVLTRGIDLRAWHFVNSDAIFLFSAVVSPHKCILSTLSPRSAARNEAFIRQFIAPKDQAGIHSLQM